MNGLVIDNSVFSIESEVEYVRKRIKRLIYSEYGNMIGFLDYGSRMNEYFHMPAIPETALFMADELKDLIKNYEQKIELLSIQVRLYSSTEASKSVKAEFDIEFNFKNNPSEEFQITV